MFALPSLPYAYDALAPVISDRTLRFHHDKHHAGYVRALNARLEATAAAPEPLEAVIQRAAKSGDHALFNSAAQAWNHSFFWDAMSARREAPTGELATAIDRGFGTLAGLKTALVAEGSGHFGSGWVWLVANKAGDLSVVSTHDAGNVLAQAGMTPLLVCDLWEHAYYLDHQNDRTSFLEAWFDALPHWSLAGSQFAAAQGGGEPWRHPAPAMAGQSPNARAA